MAFRRRGKSFRRRRSNAVTAKIRQRRLENYGRKRFKSLLHEIMENAREIFVRIATNKDCENIQNLVFGVLRESGLTPDPDGTDADISDIETNYLNRGGLFEILEDVDGNLLGTVGLFPIDAET